MTQNRLFFFDTTLRDGEQSPGCSMNIDEKLPMAHALEALGVDIIEAGFATASDGDFAAIDSIAKAVRGPRITSLARARITTLKWPLGRSSTQTARAFMFSLRRQTFTCNTS